MRESYIIKKVYALMWINGEYYNEYTNIVFVVYEKKEDAEREEEKLNNIVAWTNSLNLYTEEARVLYVDTLHYLALRGINTILWKDDFLNYLAANELFIFRNSEFTVVELNILSAPVL